MEGNPPNWTDPSGEFPFIPLLIAIGLGGLAGGTIYGWGTQVINNPSWQTGSDRWGAITHADWIKGAEEWGKIGAIGSLAVGAPIAALVTAPAAALIGGATNIIAGIATGSYSNSNGLGSVLLDAWVGTAFGGWAGNFLGSVKYFSSTGTRWAARSLGYGTINAAQGTFRKWAGSEFLDESYQTNEMVRDGAIDFAVGFLGMSAFDKALASDVSGLYLRSARAAAYNQQFDKLTASLLGQGIGMISVSNVTRPLISAFLNQYFIEPMHNMSPSEPNLTVSMHPHRGRFQYPQLNFNLQLSFPQYLSTVKLPQNVWSDRRFPSYSRINFQK